MNVSPEDVVLDSESPLPSCFLEPLIPSPMRFSSMPSIGGVWIFCGITQYKTNEIGLIRYFEYILGGYNFACLCYASQGEYGFFVE